MLLKPGAVPARVGTARRCFSTLYRVDAIEARYENISPCCPSERFSTLYRVDAIEAAFNKLPFRNDGMVSVPSIGSMLLKPDNGRDEQQRPERFSTLYRVDAIEALRWPSGHRIHSVVSVPSIGSMLLKPFLMEDCEIHHTAAFQYPLSGRCY